MKLRHLHVPKTGGTAIRWALRGTDVNVEPIDHSLRLCDLADDEQGIIVLRDPVQRFVSAYHGACRTVRAWERWPTLDDAADHIAELPEHYMVWMSTYPLVYWYHDAETVRRKAAFVLHTETLDEDWETARRGIPGAKSLPAPGHECRNDLANNGVTRAIPSPRTDRILRDFYAADYELMEALS